MTTTPTTGRVPTAVYVLAAGIFAMVTSEFAVAGLMPQLAETLGTGIEQIGYLVTVFAVAMSVGGPIMTLALLRLPPKSALMVIFGVFLVGNVLAALATTYPVMVVARVIGGMASQAFFGLSLSLCARLVDERMRGRAVGVAMNGLMLGTLLGLPFATFIGGRFGWQSAFWTISLLTVVAAILTLAFVKTPGPDGTAARPTTSAAEELAVLRRPRFLLAIVSSTLIIGATFSVFSFFTPILTRVTGFSEGTVPLLLLAYGAATLIGNTVVGRLADRHTISTLVIGTGLNVLFLTGFALFTDLPPTGTGLHARHRPGRSDHEPGDGGPCPAGGKHHTAGQHGPQLVHHARGHRRFGLRIGADPALRPSRAHRPRYRAGPTGRPGHPPGARRPLPAQRDPTRGDPERSGRKRTRRPLIAPSRARTHRTRALDDHGPEPPRSP
ncbi:MFS transporter [Nocardiopsis alba]|uniref:MFS transporter n=1 Tax=Nocardiopsis alba TaxID=53437 RepID=UPI0033D32B76